MHCWALPYRGRSCPWGLGWRSPAVTHDHQRLYLRHQWLPISVRYYLCEQCEGVVLTRHWRLRTVINSELFVLPLEGFFVPFVDSFYVGVFNLCFRIQPFVPAWFLFELFNCLNCGALLVKTAFTEWNLPCFCLNSKFTWICSAFHAFG